MESILDFLNNFYVKTLMIGIGTFILRKWPKFVNQAAATWTGFYSVVTALLGGLFPAQEPTAMAGGLMLVAATSTPWWQHLLGVVLREGILPWFTGFGGTRAIGQTLEHAQGATIPTEIPHAIETKPFQTMLSPTQEKKVEAAKE